MHVPLAGAGPQGPHELEGPRRAGPEQPDRSFPHREKRLYDRLNGFYGVVFKWACFISVNDPFIEMK